MAGLLLLSGCKKDNWQIPIGSDAVPMEEVKVEVLKNSEGKWILTVNGEPYFVNGAATNRFHNDPARFGGNTIRLYTTGTAVKDIMDNAYKSGMKVYLGVGMKAASGFNYSDAAKVKEQKENILAMVNRYKKHPALLCWSLGNEIEASNDTNIDMWKAVGDLAAAVKAEDPNHPITLALAGSGDTRMKNLVKYAPDVDFLSVNAYYPLPKSIPDNISKAGLDIPYMLTEFGPRGTWSMSPEPERILPWGDNFSESSKALVEETSTEKEAIYLNIWEEGVTGNADRGCLGGFIFVWGYQTHGEVLNWYGTHTKDRYSFGCCDAMQKCWTGEYPANRAPRIESRKDMTLNGKVAEDAIRLAPGSKNSAKVKAVSQSGTTVKYHWFIFKEGDKESDGSIPNGIADLIEKDGLAEISFKAPASTGAYRLYVYVLDDVNKKAASACIPFYVE